MTGTGRRAEAPEAASGGALAPSRRPCLHRQRHPRRARIRKRPDFLATQENGRRLAGACYLLYARERTGAGDTSSGARLGVTVSKKVGNAVVRNRVKRWVRESYRRMSELAPAGLDVVVIARPAAAALGLQGTSQELRGLLRRLGRR